MAADAAGPAPSTTRAPPKTAAPAPKWGTRNVDAFEKLEQIGEGTYGQVYKARSRDDGSIVALKKIRMTKDQEKDGFPITALREIKILKVLHHPNVVCLREIVTSAASDANKGKGSIYMVFEFMDHDLTGLLDSAMARFTVPQIKCYLAQLLEGLRYCHENRVLHRDIKGANLLINNRGELKLADFGLARPFDDQSRSYTNRCITLWYRPPELLLGAIKYGPEVDLWSVGCVFGEMLLRKPTLPGKEEGDQFELICRLCGTPDESNWPGVSQLPMYERLVSQAQARRGPMQRQVRERFGRAISDRFAIDLLDKLLALNPEKRISCAEALRHSYFCEEPLPARPQDLPQYSSSHEFNRKGKRGQAQQQQPQAAAGRGSAPHGSDKRARPEASGSSGAGGMRSGGGPHQGAFASKHQRNGMG